MGNSEIERIDASIKDAQSLVNFGSAIERLKLNRDFRTVVSDGYFKAEALRLVFAKADVALQSPESQAAITAQIDAIGAFNTYLQNALRQAAIARKQVSEGEQMRQEMLADEAADKELS